MQPLPDDDFLRETVLKAKKHLGQKIRNLRKDRDWTQEDFARVCGISATRLGRAERGQADLGLETLIVIAKKFETTLAELLTNID